MNHTAKPSFSTECTHDIAEAFNFESHPFHHIRIEGRRERVYFPIFAPHSSFRTSKSHRASSVEGLLDDYT
jgi:hypothetical protein